jgi:DNA helicase-2/ATP-dependent DNA helicase PcrA
MMAIRDFIEGMSEEQMTSARFTSEPVLTLAGAGSGKTRMLMGRVAHLLESEANGGLGADPGSIMMVTFTNKAAREMRERIAPILDELREQNNGTFKGEPWIGTFHGLSLRILRIEADKAGLGRNFSIFDESDARSLANDVVEEMEIEQFDVDEFFRDLETAKARMLDPGFLASGRDKLKAHKDSGADETRESKRWSGIMNYFQSDNFIEIYARYQGALQEQNAVDFNDLLNRTTRLMQQSEEVRNAWRSSFRHFMVDEVQDINRAQVAWLTAMTDGGREMEIPDSKMTSEHGDASEGMHEINTYRLRKFPRPTIAFVGDDDQSIYAFRGSEVEVMRGLEQRYPGLEKKFLRTSYRCQPSILKLSNELVALNTNRFGNSLVPFEGATSPGPVNFWNLGGKGWSSVTPQDEIKRICAEAEAYLADGGAANEFAVLTRTRDLGKAVAKALRASGLPVVEGKSSDLRKTAEVKDIMGFVTYLTNQDAEVPLRRIINKPSRGLGPTSLRKVTQNARVKNSTFLEEFKTVLNDRVNVPDDGEPYKAAFVQAAKSFGHMMYELDKSVTDAPDANSALMAVLRQTGYLGEMYKNAMKSAGLSKHESEANKLDPKEFLQWMLKANTDSSDAEKKEDALLDGEDLADRAGQMSEAARRIGNVALLLEETKSFETLADFAQESVLEMNQTVAPSGIQVLTIHGSKGLEFDHVRLPFWIEGVMPHGRAVDAGEKEIEEERRLAYVAITRARKTVEISSSINVSGCPFIRQRFAKRSRFIEEMVPKQEFGTEGRSKYLVDSSRVRVMADCKEFAYEMSDISKQDDVKVPVKAAPTRPLGKRIPETRETAVSYEDRFSEEPSGMEGYDLDGRDYAGADADADWGDRYEDLPMDANDEERNARNNAEPDPDPAPF